MSNSPPDANFDTNTENHEPNYSDDHQTTTNVSKSEFDRFSINPNSELEGTKNHEIQNNTKFEEFGEGAENVKINDNGSINDQSHDHNHSEISPEQSQTIDDHQQEGANPDNTYKNENEQNGNSSFQTDVLSNPDVFKFQNPQNFSDENSFHQENSEFHNNNTSLNSNQEDNETQKNNGESSEIEPENIPLPSGDDFAFQDDEIKPHDPPNEPLNEQSSEQSNELLNEHLNELPNEQSSELPNEQSNELLNEHLNELPNEQSSEQSNELLNEQSNELLNEHLNELPNEHLNELPNEHLNELPNEHLNELQNEDLNELQNEQSNELPNEHLNELQNEDLNELQNEQSNELPNEHLNELPNEDLNEQPNEQLNEQLSENNSSNEDLHHFDTPFDQNPDDFANQDDNLASNEESQHTEIHHSPKSEENIHNNQDNEMNQENLNQFPLQEQSAHSIEDIHASFSNNDNLSPENHYEKENSRISDHLLNHAIELAQSHENVNQDPVDIVDLVADEIQESAPEQEVEPEQETVQNEETIEQQSVSYEQSREVENEEIVQEMNELKQQNEKLLDEVQPQPQIEEPINQQFDQPPQQFEEQHQQFEEQHQQIEEQHQQIEEQHQQIEEQHQQFEEQHQQIEEQHQQIEEQHQQIEEQHQQIEEQHQQIEEQHQQIDQQHQQNAEEQQIQTEKQSVEEAQGQNEQALAEEQQNHEQHIEEIVKEEKSTSVEEPQKTNQQVEEQSHLIEAHIQQPEAHQIQAEENIPNSEIEVQSQTTNEPIMTEEKLEDHASHVPLPPDNVDEDEQLKDDTHKITQEQVEESVVEKAEQEEIKPLEEIHNEEVQQQFVHESVNPEEHDESKTEEVQQEEAKPEISNNEETPSGEAKQDEIVHQEQQTEEPQNEEPSQMEPQTEELKSEESKPEEDKPVEVKTEESKPEEVKHVEIKHEEPKKENEHRPVTHVHHIEKTGINNLLSPQSSSPRHKIIAPVTPLSHVQLNDQSEHHQAVSQTATTTTPTTPQSPTEIHSTKPVGMSSILVGEEKKHVKKIMAAPKIKKINALDRMLNTDTNNASQSSQGATVNTNKVSTSSNVVTTSSNVTQQTNINSNNSNSGTNNSSTTATAHTVQQNVGSTPEVKKRVVTAPAAVSRKIQTPKLPDWQVKLATTFLMTTDMSCTLDDVDMSNSENHGGPGPDIDQITEDTTRCVCNSTHESDVMIQCDCCKKWLHEDCVKLLNSREVDPFICIFCQAEMSKAVKEYIRKKLNAFAPIIQRCQNELQYDIRQTQPIWGEIMEIVRDSQEVLRMIPLFLPTSDRSEDQSDLYK